MSAQRGPVKTSHVAGFDRKNCGQKSGQMELPCSDEAVLPQGEGPNCNRLLAHLREGGKGATKSTAIRTPLGTTQPPVPLIGPSLL